MVYCIDVETFFYADADADGDGCGDLRGLTDRLDYLGGIGVSCGSCPSTRVAAQGRRL